MADRKSFWAWCLESEEPSDADRAALAAKLSARYGTEIVARPVPSLDDAELRDPRITVPGSVAGWCSTTVYDRARYAYGAHFTERVRAFNLDFANPPDVVAHPRDETEVEATLDWCNANGYVTVPYGGGSSVVWGVTPHEDIGPTVVISLDRLDRVLEIDDVSRAARIQAGVFGPHLEDQLRPSGHTLRHFPQSFRFSTLGGWIATRSGGHYATNHTHIDDFVESVRMITPAGWWESRRLPGSGAGPSPDRMVIGSEGVYGIITEAWMRIQRRPVFRATAGVTFESWPAGCEAVRHLVQAKLWPANLRILDPEEARRAAGLDGEQALVIVSFESAELTQRHNIVQAVEIARDCGGHVTDDEIRVDDGTGAAHRPRRRGGRLAQRLHRSGQRRGDVAGPGQRHLRDGHHMGPLARLRRRDPIAGGRRAGRHVRTAPLAVVPLHPRVHRRPRALLHMVGHGRARQRDRPVADHQGRGQRGSGGRGRDRHPPSRGGPHAPAPRLRPPAPRTVRTGGAGRQEAPRPQRHPQPRRPHRPLSPGCLSARPLSLNPPMR